MLAAKHLGADRITVICPAIVRPHWAREAEVMGLRPDALLVDSYSRYVTSATLRDEIAARRSDLLILDEAHYLKSTDAQRTRLLLGPKSGLARTVPVVWPLSGTPMPRNPSELFAPLASLWPAQLQEFGIRRYVDFLNRFCVWKMTDYGIRVFGVRNAAELRQLLAPVLLRRLLADVEMELPPIRWTVETLGGTPLALRELAKLLDELVSPEEREALEAGEIPPLSPNLARARHAIGDVKVHATIALLREELQADETAKRVVMAHHRSVLAALQKHLQAAGVAYIDGNTPPSARENAIRRFQTDPATRVFLGQIQACATGITLTAADNIVIVEPEWSSDINVQAAKRIHRIGQDKPCLVRMVALAETLDEAIVRNHHREVAMVADVVGS